NIDSHRLPTTPMIGQGQQRRCCLVYRGRSLMACVRRVLHGRLAPGLLCAIFALASVGQPIHAQQAEPPATESETATEPAKRVVVRFLTESDFPPFNFYDEDGVLTGFNVDLARAICLELGTACDIKV